MTPSRIILVLVDTLRADYLGCYGDPGGLSPNIDRLASHGARFEAAYSASNFTAPAVASLFTSFYPTVHGVYDFRIKKLPPAPLLEIAAKNGCFRKAVVDFGFFKSFLGRSFDDMESLTDLAPNWSTEGPVVETRRAAEWIAEHRDEPFFLFVHISPPHVPYRFPRGRYEEVTTGPAWRAGTELVRRHPVLGRLFPSPEGDRIPEREVERFNRASREIEHVEMDEALIGAVRDLYRMEVRVVDDVIGNLTRELERLGIFESTLISVSADHGEELWDHGSFGHGARAMHNEVIRTPWILACPERIPSARVVDRCVSQTNLLPTLLDIAGFDLAGVPAAPSVKRFVTRGAGEDTETERGGTADGFERAVFSDTARRISVVYDGFKLIAPSRRTRFADRRERIRDELRRVKAALSGADRRATELFDLIGDPGEKENLAAREKKRVSALARLIDRYYGSEPRPLAGGAGDGGSDLTATEEEQMRKELDGLGYL